MEFKCPGRTANAGKDTLVIACPSCRREVELFGDEQRARCRCGQWILRDVIPSCARWCPSAQQCLGDVGNLAKMAQAADGSLSQEEQLIRLHELRERIAQARHDCTLAEAKKEA